MGRFIQLEVAAADTDTEEAVENKPSLNAKQQTVLKVAILNQILQQRHICGLRQPHSLQPEWGGRLQLPDDAGDGTWHPSQQPILILNYSNPEPNHPNQQQHPLVSTQAPRLHTLQHFSVHTATGIGCVFPLFRAGNGETK